MCPTVGHVPQKEQKWLFPNSLKILLLTVFSGGMSKRWTRPLNKRAIAPTHAERAENLEQAIAAFN